MARGIRLSAIPRRAPYPFVTVCGRCHVEDATVHPRRVGGLAPVMICNRCTRERRRQEHRARTRGVAPSGRGLGPYLTGGR